MSIENDGTLLRGVRGAVKAAGKPEHLRRRINIRVGIAKVGELKRGADGLEVVVGGIGEALRIGCAEVRAKR